MVQIYYNRADGDNVKAVIDIIKDLSQKWDKVCLVLPEQLTIMREFEISKHRLDNVTVLSFGRLCNEIFRTFGGTALKTPDSASASAALYRALSSVRNQLTYYRSAKSSYGFVTKLMQTFTNFDTNCISASAIENIPELNFATKSKYRDLFMIYDEYKRIWKEGYRAPGNDIKEASGVLELNDMFSKTAVVFDGFYGYTAEQHLMLEQIITQSPDCRFLFTTDLQDDLFDTVTAEVSALRRLCKKTDTECVLTPLVTAKRFNAPDLARLEKCSFMQEGIQISDSDALTVYSATNLNEELGFIACKIKNDVLSGKYRYRDIAVICPSADEVSVTAAAVFEKHGVPLHLDTHPTLLSKPVVAFILHALEIAKDGFEFEPVFSLLKTGLTDLDFDSISMLENYARLWKLRPCAWNGKAWTKNPDGIGTKEIDTARLDSINETYLYTYSRLARFVKGITSASDCTSMLECIVKLLEDFCVYKNLERIADGFYEKGDLSGYNEYMRVYDILIDMLDSIQTVMNDKQLSVLELIDLISICAGQVNVTRLPSRADEVIFASVGRVRTDVIKCVYIPRLNDGVIPRPLTDDPIITDADKRVFASHGIRTSMDFVASAKRERFDLYSAMCFATDELVLSYSMFDITGSPRVRSSYLENIINITDITPKDRADLPPEFYMVSVPAINELGARGEYDGIKKAVQDITGIAPIERRERDETLEKGVVEALYSKHLRLSFSGIEEYVNCPFKFFIHRGLRADKKEPAEFNPANVGTFIHSGLESLLSDGFDVKTADDKTLKDRISKISDDYKSTVLSDFADGSKRFDYLFSRARYAFENAALNVADEIKGSKLTPFAFELDISDCVSDVALKNGYTMSLVGSIDRVDMTDDRKYAKIVDYKSGKQKFSLKKMYNGLSMQLPIYAGAVRSKYKTTDILAMYYLRVGVPESEKTTASGLSDAEYDKSIFDYYVRDGIYAADSIDMLDDSGRFFNKIKSERLTDNDGINQLIDSAMSKTVEIAEGIASGNIAVSPVKDTGINACEYCDYKNICLIDKRQDAFRKLDPIPEKKGGDE